jgi:hypothetical protein
MRLLRHRIDKKGEHNTQIALSAPSLWLPHYRTTIAGAPMLAG